MRRLRGVWGYRKHHRWFYIPERLGKYDLEILLNLILLELFFAGYSYLFTLFIVGAVVEKKRQLLSTHRFRCFYIRGSPQVFLQYVHPVVVIW